MVREPKPFFYMAAKPGGGRSFGVKRARDQRQLNEQLRRERLVPLRTWSLPDFGSGGKVGLKDQAELHTQLSQLLTRGVPLVEALDTVTSAVSATMRPKVERMRELVAGGAGFADACLSVGGFDNVTIAVYRAAERTGDLGGAAKQLATTLRRQLAVQGKAVTLLLYPTVVLTISVIVSIGMLAFIVPRIIGALKQAVKQLPWFTELVYSVGVTLRDNFVIFLAFLAGVAIFAVVGRGLVARAGRAVMRSAPVLKDVVLAQESARFFTVMSALTKSGVVLADALGVAVQALSHPALREQLTRLRTRLIEGGVLRHLIDEVTALPLPTRRLMIAAERSGDLQQAFDTLAADMTEEVDRRSARLLALMEPALIVVMFVMIGTLVMSIMVPLLTISGRVMQ